MTSFYYILGKLMLASLYKIMKQETHKNQLVSYAKALAAKIPAGSFLKHGLLKAGSRRIISKLLERTRDLSFKVPH